MKPWRRRLRSHGQRRRSRCRPVKRNHASSYQNKLKEAGMTGTDMQLLRGILPMREFDTNGCTDVGM